MVSAVFVVSIDANKLRCSFFSRPKRRTKEKAVSAVAGRNSGRAE